ncbi:dual specificity protein phosphatase 12-like [Saccoglossus kowalevskii]|uniref:Dual specificity protein phosphatase 12-like n=1 Tax=Saccoglossus kowalevskii TaxID=10224 RepID=A0ABM0M9S1_SACKO|nr:PREDICTED: dual specificity protein phosphatase 12-like [Saccoglossus kowalevskii]
MDCIEKGLYIGGSADARNTEALHSAGITHVLSIELVKPQVSSDFVHKFVHLMDEEEYDLLSKFPECISFVKEGIKKGGVLVHCAMGASRSATVVIAYIMNTKISLEDTLIKVKEKRSWIRPNDGFMHQLRIYDAMGGDIQPENLLYKQYLLDFRSEVREPVVYVTFKVNYCLKQTDGLKHLVAVTGDHRLLGRWKKHRVLKNKWGPDSWEITLAFSQNTTLNWKFVVVEYQKASSRQYGPKSTYGCGKVLRWEDGNNRVLNTGTEEWTLIEGEWGKC